MFRLSGCADANALVCLALTVCCLGDRQGGARPGDCGTAARSRWGAGARARRDDRWIRTGRVARAGAAGRHPAGGGDARLSRRSRRLPDR